MFEKKKDCPHCEKKVSSKYEFCPHCGERIAAKNNRKKQEEYGFLGIEDDMNMLEDFSQGIFGGLLGSIAKTIEKEIEEAQKQKQVSKGKKTDMKRSGISISISQNGNRPPEIRVEKYGDPTAETPKKQKMKMKKFGDSQLKQFSKLPRVEPKTSVRRFSNRVVYELELPGVKSVEDIALLTLENSIEIKAVSDKKSYSKIIPVSLPIAHFEVTDGKLILELDAKE